MQIKGVRIFEDPCKDIILDLKDILGLIDNGVSYDWTVFAVEAIMALNASQEVLRIYEAIKNSKKDCKLNWSELNIFSQNVFQVRDGYFLASCSLEAIHAEDFDEVEMLKKCDIAIVMNDSYYWDIYTKNQKLYDIFISYLKNDSFLEVNI